MILKVQPLEGVWGKYIDYLVHGLTNSRVLGGKLNLGGGGGGSQCAPPLYITPYNYCML